ncbi:hypothetical protein GIY62_00050 [Burkholderia plantarii]|uniref:hypothetical protein n=1 Tax=Burkholderia plantarii TaxID=41899 RepID=UPI00272B72FA|nr:hypothetical protein [Burkholderia plantarii]WLE59145.1 hypothetical protein GIY62_00050 [Burkholderia plantarii]
MTFINKASTCANIARMEKPMHASVARLLAAANRKDRTIVRLADLARALNKSEQVLNNWAYRGHGVSKEGRLLAQKMLGIDATWIEDGKGLEFASDDLHTELTPNHQTADNAALRKCSPAAQTLIDSIIAADGAGISNEIFEVLQRTLELFLVDDSPRSTRPRKDEAVR